MTSLEEQGQLIPDVHTLKHISFIVNPSDTGFYVAIQDVGTCVGISRLRVYYYICPSRQEGLVLYPETPAQDVGTCVGISRLRVYHYICPSRQEGLVLYPETPAPVSGSVNVQFTCVDNAESESDTLTCNHDGTWSTEVPVHECNVGYENMGINCSGKSINTRQLTHTVSALLLLYSMSYICHHAGLIELRM